MSLIDEALKRARMEAAQKAAEREGLPYPAIPRHVSGKPRRPAWLVPALVAAAMLLGLLGGLVLSRRGPAELERTAAVAAPAAVQATRPVPAVPIAAGAEQTVDDAPARSGAEGLPLPASAPAAGTPAADAPPDRPAEPRPEPARREPGPPATNQAAAPPAALPADPSPVTPGPAAADATQPAPPQPTAISDPASGLVLVLADPAPASVGRTPAGPSEAESHVQRFSAPDGASIELGGIAWSETGPFALINGRVLGTGDTVGEFTIERIGPRHVELRGGGRLVHLSLQ